MAFSFEPSILLRGVVPSEVIENYNRGAYRNIKIPTKPETPGVSFAAAKLAASEMTTYKDRMNIPHVVTVTSNIIYNHCATGKEYHTFQGAICNWCRREIKDAMMGIPVSTRKVVVPGKGEVTIFDMEGAVCSFECALAMIRSNTNMDFVRRDSLYENSKSLLLMLYNMVYPKAAPLREAQDWRLLRHNMGPLSEEEFFRVRSIFRRTTNVVLFPIKVEYEYVKTTGSENGKF